jgi:lipopolysaccharide/colanic/teichoic acid biosynthesis glycosyltransferase/dTDP-glucose pyrophosphorylase
MKNFMNKLRIKKAVILEEGQTPKLPPLSIYYPICMFPILNKPLIEYTIDFLKKNGFEEIIIALSEETEIPDYLKHIKVSGINIKFHKEDRPRGTAGTLKDLEKFIEIEPFLVIVSNLFLGSIDLTKFIKLHMEAGAVATVGVYRENIPKIKENVIINNNNTIKSFHLIHSSMDRRSPWRPSGIYLFNPLILRFIDRKNYMDIKEQLIPDLQKEGLNVSACEIEGFHFRLQNMDDYIIIHRNLLLKNNYNDFEGKEEIVNRVWVGKDVKISPRAYLLGPIFIGDRCEIKDWVQIIGPTVIGNRCQISEEVIIRESIIWNDVSLSKRSMIEYSIVGGNADIPDNFYSKNMVLLNGLSVRDVNLIPSDQSIKGIINLSDIVSTIGGRQKIYEISKRIMDVTLSAFGIILLFPLFLLIAIAIKMDSPGPIFYIQKRCGKGGGLFGMLKFRTMVANAERLQKELIAKNEIDGPIFKMPNDPRVTRLGRILRETSFDEIPQLYNILKGEMSLVGPRPLIMDEMKFSPSWRDTRLKVKPGITGLWQIQGRSEAPFHDWIRYDVFYVKNQSLWMDIKIVFKTIKVVLKKSGAY